VQYPCSGASGGIIKKFLNLEFWRRHLRDGLAEPMHIRAISVLVALFGGVRSKIDFDLFERRPYAFGILSAADIASQRGIAKIAVIEFGVASGRGLLSMSRIASAISNMTGIQLDVVGFDTGKGMPPAVDYRDHPEDYFEGDFAPDNLASLIESLPGNTRLIVGNISETVPEFVKNYDGVIGFVSVDVDYYSSAKDCLKIFTEHCNKYLPWSPVFFDDVLHDSHNAWCGEKLAIDEFNKEHALRKIAPFNEIRNKRIMKSASWLPQMYCLHVLDHPLRSVSANKTLTPRKM
jgi:hypothetical protein